MCRCRPAASARPSTPRGAIRFCRWDGIFKKGWEQGKLNAINGVQDIVIGTVNIVTLGPYNGASWIVNQFGGENPYLWIPSPDWSRGLLTEEYGTPGSWGDMHGWSKWLGGNSFVALFGALGPKMGISVGNGAPSPQGSGFHFTFKVGNKWYHAAGDKLGKLRMSKGLSQDPLASHGNKPWFTIDDIPILSQKMATPIPRAPALTCATATVSAWMKGGGVVFVLPPFIKPLNDFLQNDK